MAGAVPASVPATSQPREIPPYIAAKLAEIVASARVVRAAVGRLPARSPGRIRVEARIDHALQLARAATDPTPRVGDFGANLAAAADELMAAYRFAKRTAHALLTLPVELIQRTYRGIDAAIEFPAQVIRETGAVIRDAANEAIAALERNRPEILSFFGQVYAGIGLGVFLLVGLGLVLLLRK